MLPILHNLSTSIEYIVLLHIAESHKIKYLKIFCNNKLVAIDSVQNNLLVGFVITE